MSGHSKSESISKPHDWFNSNDDFADYLVFAYWWSCIGKGLRLQTASFCVCSFSIDLVVRYFMKYMHI